MLIRSRAGGSHRAHHAFGNAAIGQRSSPAPPTSGALQRAADESDDDEFRPAPDETLSGLLADYELATGETDEAVAGIGQGVRVPRGVPWFPAGVDEWSVRWVLLLASFVGRKNLGRNRRRSVVPERCSAGLRLPWPQPTYPRTSPSRGHRRGCRECRIPAGHRPRPCPLTNEKGNETCQFFQAYA
jgi:hypothetical protein